MMQRDEHREFEEGGPLYRIIALSAIALAIGLTVAFAAIAFVEAVSWLNHALLVSPRSRVQVEDSPWLLTAATLLVPSLGGLLVGLMLNRLSSEKRSLGPPDVVQAVQLRQPMPKARSGLMSTAAALLSLGFGASVGQYGPMVYLGALIAEVTTRLRLRVHNLAAIAIACGVAAAISTAFNAPIAGLVFAHEVVLRHYSMQAFAPTTVASASGYVVANVVFERPALFLVQFDGVDQGYEFLLFAGLGLLAAAVAVVYMRLILAAAALAARSHIAPVLRPAVAGLALGLTALWLPDVLGIGQEALRFATIEGAFTADELLLVFLAKILLTALSIGFGFAGGVFSPALLIGVLFGALFWTLLGGSGLIETSGIAVYAVCGMMAVTSPVIGAPLTTILIVFELTRSYDLTIAAMVAVVFSNLVAYRVFGRSLFDVQLAKRGVDLSTGRDRARLESVRVARYATQDFPKLASPATVGEALSLLRASQRSEVFVVDAEGVLQGIFRTPESLGDPALELGGSLRPPRLILEEDTSIWKTMAALKGFVGDAVPIVDRTSGRLVGVVTEAAIIAAYLEIVHDLRSEENKGL